MKRHSLVLASAILLMASVQIDPSVAQQTSTSNRAAPSANLVLIPGAMAEARTMGPTGYRRLCAPLSVGLYEWRVQWLERLLKPTDVQKTPLNDLLAVSNLQGSFSDLKMPSAS